MADIQVKKSQIDSNGDKMISQEEWNNWIKTQDNTKSYKIVDDNGTKLYEGELGELETKLQSEFSKAAEAPEPKVAEANAKLKELETQMKDLQLKIAKAQEAKDQAQLEKLQKELAQLIKIADQYNNVATKKLNLSSFYKSAGQAAKSKPMSGKANVNFGGQQGFGAKAQTAGATAQATSGGFSPPANWGAQGLGDSMPMFNSDAYMKTMAMEDNIMSSWDAINKSTSRGKQLMMLFFYFARMAESGDMTAMYQFMKFITYIISKDKAKQQIEMGKKLIQLQELSRSWTNKLLNVQTNSADPAASNELMKTMTIVKSETDAIATSQKLISQMMEEFAQVVETLTNTTKAALETAGRIMRTVSTMR